MVDLKDHKILYELDINSRAFYSEIGKKVGLPKSVVFHRIQSLTKSGIIKSFYPLVCFTEFGYAQYKVYIKFQMVSPSIEKKIIEFLSNRKNIAWVISCRGRWDLSFTVLAKNSFEFDKILIGLINKFGAYFLDKTVAIATYSPVYSRNYLVKGKAKEEFIYASEPKEKKLNAVDARILNVLSDNARVSVLDIMQKSGLSRDIISYRIKKMQKSGIILCYRTLIDLSKIGYKLYKIIVRAHNFTRESQKELEIFCKSKSNVVQYMKLVGNWDLEIEVEVQDDKQLQGIVLEMREKFPKIIRDYELLEITQEYKVNYTPFKDSER